MALQEVNTILQVLQEGLRARSQREQFAKEVELREQDKEYRERQFEEVKKQQEVQNKANQAMFELQRKQLDAAQAQTDLSNALTYQKTGITPPGTEVIPAEKPAPFQVSPIMLQNTPMEGSAITGTDPRMLAQIVQQTQGTTETRTPQVNPPLTLSELQEAKLIPKSGKTYSVPLLAQTPEQQLIRQQLQEAEAAKIRERQADQAATLMRMAEVARLEHSYKMDEQVNAQDAANKLRDKINENNLAVARIRVSSTGLGDLENLPGAEDYLNRGLVGGMSAEDLRKLFTPKDAAQFNKLAMEKGFQFLPNTKTGQIKAVESMVDIIPHIRKMLNLMYAHPAQVNNPLSKYGQDFKAEKDVVRAASPQASVAFTGVRRFSNPELDRFDAWFVPSKAPLVSSATANLTKLNEFEHKINEEIKDLTRGMTKHQTDAIVDYMRTKGFHFVGTTELPGQGGQTKQEGQGNVIIWVPNPKTGVLEPQKQ